MCSKKCQTAGDTSNQLPVRKRDIHVQKCVARATAGTQKKGDRFQESGHISSNGKVSNNTKYRGRNSEKKRIPKKMQLCILHSVILNEVKVGSLPCALLAAIALPG